MIESIQNFSPEDILFFLDKQIENYEIDDIIRLKYYTPTEKAKELYRLSLKARQILMSGGVRTGKTYAGLVQRYFNLTGLYPEVGHPGFPNGWEGYKFKRPINTLMASVSHESAVDILQTPLFEGARDGTVPPIIHPSLIGKIVRSNIPGAYKSVEIKHVPSGQWSKIFFKAYTQKANKMQGVKYDDSQLDESVDFDFFQEILMRTSSFGKEGEKESTFANLFQWPEKGMDETNCYFMEKIDDEGKSSLVEPGEVHKGRVYIHIGWDDNPHMSPEERQRLEDSVPPYLLEARKNGKPVFGHGKVFIQPEELYTIKPFDLSEKQFSHYKWLFGLDPSASSGGTWGAVVGAVEMNDNGTVNRIYIQKDYKLSNATPTEHASNIRNLLPFDGCPGMTDPAGAGENMHTKESTIDFLRNKSGLNLIKANKANGIKDATIDYIYELIRQGKLFIMYDPNTHSGCVNLMKEIRQYHRNDVGGIVKRDDHCIDSWFYLINGLVNAVSKNYHYYQDYQGGASYV